MFPIYVFLVLLSVFHCLKVMGKEISLNEKKSAISFYFTEYH